MRPSRNADLCWGQRYHWLRYLRAPEGSRHESHISDGYPLPEPITVDALRSALTYLIRRHEVLRTVYDPHAHPWPQQVVQPVAALPIRQASTEADGTVSPTEVIQELTHTDFCLETEWPIRVCAITTGGMVGRVHLVLNHIAFDDVSLDLLRNEFGTVLAAMAKSTRAVLPPVASQPVDLARREGTLHTDNDASRHWRRVVSELPSDVYASRRVPPPETDAAHSASLTSPTLLGTAKAIAERHRVWPSAVHVAAYAVATACYTGEPVVAHRMYTSQRQAAGQPLLMGCMSYPTPVVLDLSDDPPFSEVLRRATHRVGQSLDHAHVPYDEVLESLAREGFRRGEPVRAGGDTNLLDYAPASCGARRVRFSRNPPPTDWARSGADTYFRVYQWSDGVTLMLQASAAVMDADAVERLLRGYAALLDRHADDPRVSDAAALMDFAAPDRTLLPDADSVPPAACPAAEHALAEVVGDVNDLPAVDPAQCYTTAGGRALRIPRVVATLRERGWTGVSIADLGGVRPLTHLAAHLRRT